MLKCRKQNNAHKLTIKLCKYILYSSIIHEYTHKLMYINLWAKMHII